MPSSLSSAGLKKYERESEREREPRGKFLAVPFITFCPFLFDSSMARAGNGWKVRKKNGRRYRVGNSYLFVLCSAAAAAAAPMQIQIPPG